MRGALLAWLAVVCSLGLSARQEPVFAAPSMSWTRSLCEGVTVCRGVLANADNHVNGLYFEASGSLLHFPANVVLNDRRGQCDSFVTAGYLGFAAVAVSPVSLNWTAQGLPGLLFRPSNPPSDVLLSCGVGEVVVG